MDSSEYVEWAAYTSLFLVLALIIAVVVYYMYYRTSPIPTPSSVTVWSFQFGGIVGNKATFTGDNYTIYFVNTQIPTLELEVTPPLQAPGKTFAIFNPGHTTVTVTGEVTDIVQPGTFSQYVWTGTSLAVKMY